MTDITIPPEALEALAMAILEITGEGIDMDEARAACLAMLKAWPGTIHYRGGWEPVINNHQRKPHLILPLPQEKTND